MTRLCAGLILALSILFAPAVQAQTGFAAQIGTKLITSVLGALAGHGINSIFGQGPQPVTAAELGEALDDSFKAEALKEVEADVANLRSKVRSYQKSASAESRRDQIDAITDLADHIRATAQIRIHSDGQFFELLPDYLMATNVWLAFKAERKFVSLADDATAAETEAAFTEANHIVAGEAVHALSTVNDFYYHDFVDTGKRRCYVKQPHQKFFNLTGDDIGNEVRIRKKKSKKLDITTKYCGRAVNDFLKKTPFRSFHKGLKFVINPAFGSGRSFKHPKKTEWYFTYENAIARSNERGEYILAGPYGSKSAADKARVGHAIVFYADLLGDVPGMVRAWRDLTKKIGQAHQGTEAERLSRSLGAG